MKALNGYIIIKRLNIGYCYTIEGEVVSLPDTLIEA
jgi:hypothetical protein